MGAGRTPVGRKTHGLRTLEAATTLDLLPGDAWGPVPAQKVATGFDDSLFGDLFAEPDDDALSDATHDEVAESPTKRLSGLTLAAALPHALPEESLTARFSRLSFDAALSDAFPVEPSKSPTKRLSLAAALSDALPEESLTARFSALSFDPASPTSPTTRSPKRDKSPTKRISWLHRRRRHLRCIPRRGRPTREVADQTHLGPRLRPLR